jgi:transposase
MALLSVIRCWHLRQQVPIREIERRTGLSRNTIRKYLRADAVEPQFKLPDRPSKLDPYAEKLKGWLRQEVSKSRKQKRTTKQMHADLAALGFDGSYGRVAAFVRGWKADRQIEQQTSGLGTFVPLVFAAGEAFQLDWSEDWAVVAGERTKLQVARRRLWQPLPSFPDLTALNAWLEARCIEQWDEIQHGALHGTIADVHAAERAKLMPPGRPFDVFVEHTKRVSPICLVNFECNRYSVPASFANRPVSLPIYPERIVVAAEGRSYAGIRRL